MTAYFDLKILLYSNWYEEASITNKVLFFIFLTDKIGFPILPTNFTSNFCFNKISYKS